MELSHTYTRTAKWLVLLSVVYFVVDAQNLKQLANKTKNAIWKKKIFAHTQPPSVPLSLCLSLSLSLRMLWTQLFVVCMASDILLADKTNYMEIYCEWQRPHCAICPPSLKVGNTFSLSIFVSWFVVASKALTFTYGPLYWSLSHSHTHTHTLSTNFIALGVTWQLGK